MTLCGPVLSASAILGQAVNARQRYSAVRDWPKWQASPMQWVGLAEVALVVILAVIAMTISRRRERRRRSAGAVSNRGGELGLSDEELSLLAAISYKSGLIDPLSIYTVQDAFTRGVERLLASGKLEDTLANGGSACASCSFLVSLREKLGFEILPGQARPTSVDLGPMKQGSRITVHRQRSPERFEAVVRSTHTNPAEISVRPIGQDVRSRPGESWMVHFPQGGILWEFNAWVVHHAGGEIVVRPVGEVRWINRRRFPRVPTDKPAWGAAFPFQNDEGMSAKAPEFVPGRLVEIAGPGMQLRAPLEVEVGGRVLVVVQLEHDKTVESAGVVRRIVEEDPGDPHKLLALELMGLTTGQVAELARQTNLVARRSGADAEVEVSVAVAQE